MPRGDQLERQWRLLHLLAARGGRIIPQHQCELGCSRRTVWRDLAVLQAAGFPLAASLFIPFTPTELAILHLERFRHVRATSATFKAQASLDLDHYLEGSFGLFRGRPVRVVLRFSREVARFITERRWHPTQVLSLLLTGEVDLAMRVSICPELKRWSLGYGKDVEVLEPKSPRARGRGLKQGHRGRGRRAGPSGPKRPGLHGGSVPDHPRGPVPGGGERGSPGLLARPGGRDRGASPGAPLMAVDAAMADTLKAQGFGDAYLRPAFHGVGIEHEEAPIPGGHAVIHDEEKAEHHVIQKIVGAMAVLAGGLGAGQEPPVETLHNIVQFMRTFADICHHGKEELHLFPFLEKRGVPARGCPMGVLIHEHERGRTLVAQLAQATETYASGTAPARDAVTETLQGLMELHPSHIRKEEYLLFPMSNKVLGAADQQQLREKFAEVEATVGRGVHQ